MWNEILDSPFPEGYEEAHTGFNARLEAETGVRVPDMRE
jgi:hypothetical protein